MIDDAEGVLDGPRAGTRRSTASVGESGPDDQTKEERKVSSRIHSQSILSVPVDEYHGATLFIVD
jgi:hypothetical protein